MKTNSPNTLIQLNLTIKAKVGNLTLIPEHSIFVRCRIDKSEYDGNVLQYAQYEAVNDAILNHIDNHPMDYSKIHNKSWQYSAAIIDTNTIN